MTTPGVGDSFLPTLPHNPGPPPPREGAVMETLKVLRAMGASRVADQLSRKNRLRSAWNDTRKIANQFSEENAVAISLICDLYDSKIQHALSLNLDIERQRFMIRHPQLEAETLTRIWYDEMEKHPGCCWVLADLERERDIRAGLGYLWNRRRLDGEVEPITGRQLTISDFDQEAAS